MSSSVYQLSPAVGLRLFFESVASGILLPGILTVLFIISTVVI